MLEITKIRENSAAIAKGLQDRGVEDAAEKVEKLLALDAERRQTQVALDEARSSSNKVAKSIGQLMAQGKKEEAEAAKKETGELKQRIKSGEARMNEISAEMKEMLLNFPNVMHESVPVGRNEEDNQVIYENEVKVSLPEGAKAHWDLCKTLNIIDFDLGSKITGSGFPVYRGKGARLQRALIQFFLDEAREAGFEEIMPPLMVNEASGYGTGQLPDKEGQMYEMPLDKLYMIPTAEVPITNLYRDVILEESDFPIKNCGYTPCFRREAGAHGKDVRGLNRLHQFDKVEIVVLEHPDRSYEMLDKMVMHVRGLLDKLGLPYRTLLLCTGDAGFTSAKTLDMEVYSAAQERWLEVSSISNFETFQANRLKLRFRGEGKKTQLAHTLNGSALALPRIYAALLENNQQADGSVILPEVLHSYCGFDRIEAPAS